MLLVDFFVGSRARVVDPEEAALIHQRLFYQTKVSHVTHRLNASAAYGSFLFCCGIRRKLTVDGLSCDAYRARMFIVVRDTLVPGRPRLEAHLFHLLQSAITFPDKIREGSLLEIRQYTRLVSRYRPQRDVVLHRQQLCVRVIQLRCDRRQKTQVHLTQRIDTGKDHPRDHEVNKLLLVSRELFISRH